MNWMLFENTFGGWWMGVVVAPSEAEAKMAAAALLPNFGGNLAVWEDDGELLSDLRLSDAEKAEFAQLAAAGGGISAQYANVPYCQ
jgi:hypothetical protein